MTTEMLSDYEVSGIVYGELGRSARGLIQYDPSGQLRAADTSLQKLDAFANVFVAMSKHLAHLKAHLRSIAEADTAPQEARSIVDEFKGLVQQWKDDTMFLSRTDDIVEHPAYRRIIEMGVPMLPLILDELERNGGYWFDALSEITQQDPSVPKSSHNAKDLASAWVAWGKKNVRRAS